MAMHGAGCASEEEQSINMAPARALTNIGLQLYTVRSLMENDFEGVIRSVASLGYSEVEIGWYFDRDVADIRDLLDEVGLTAPATHVLNEVLKSDLDAVLQAAQTIGHKYVICPYLLPEERTLDHYRQHAMFFNEVGEACKGAGLQFAYYNHDFEFFETDGQLPYDLLLAETDPDLVQMELDLYWIKKGGQDALAYFDAHPGRFPLCHVKDMAADGDIATVGTGTIDFASLFAASEQAGLVHYFVEHDHSDDPMQSITDAYAHLEALRF